MLTRRTLITLSFFLIWPTSVMSAEKSGLILAAANSTCTALRDAEAIFAKRRGVEITYLCKSSGRLAKGMIGQAIQPDYYISANKKWMDKVEAKGLVAAETIRIPWENTLVVAAPTASGMQLNALADLTEPGVERIMIGDPSTAPFGRYAKQALSSANLWARIRDKITTRKHITLLADDLAGMTEGSVGFLYATNLTANLRSLMTVPDKLHDPIRYYAAPLKQARHAEAAAAFGPFLQEEAAQAVFKKYGFSVVVPAGP